MKHNCQCNYLHQATLHYFTLNIKATGWVLHYTNTEEVIWQLPSFNEGSRPHMPFHALFQALTGTRAEQLIFCKLAG
jgi:hypothetical protein